MNLGIAQWFRFEEYEEAERAIDVISELGVRTLRTAISWADWERAGGTPWFDWLFGRLSAAGLEIFPSLFYTPTMRARLLPGQTPEHARTSFPPTRLEDYADFCNEALSRYDHILGDWCQIWNEPNNDAYWSPLHDPNHLAFAEMTELAIPVFRSHRKRIVLGGIIPPYTEWLKVMRSLGILDEVDAIGIHAFPGTWDKMEWRGWDYAIQLVRDIAPDLDIWITETGFSTATLKDQSAETQKFRERQQIAYFDTAWNAPADQAFWFCAIDQDRNHPTDNALNRGTTADPRAYYFGLVDRDGKKKPLFTHWKKRLIENQNRKKAA